VTRSLGSFAVLLALALASGGAVLAFSATRPGRDAFLTAARRAAAAIFVLVLFAALTMEYALITHDFSVKYVAQVGSRETPLFYTIISLWSALEGSILLWALILAGYTAVLARWLGRHPDLAEQISGAHTLGALLVVNVFFLLLIAWPANPFVLVDPAPANGPGPNPLLQNHWFMGVHPPLLYTGYVGMAVPFAFAMGALFAGRLGPEWPRAIRRWTLVPWAFLSLGIVAGAWWSYEVLGWGGYWAWDPVENASFMPWLTATAFLHSVMVSERRGMLKTWTLTLIVTTFLLTLLGTFITRSGVLASVHAFTQSLIGPFFLVFFGLVLLVSLGLLAARGERLRSDGRLDSPLSRETAFLLNNLFFTAFAFVVLLGTMYPLLAEALRGAKVSVGAPYFNQMNVPIALALIFLLGVGPALPWRKGSLALLGRKLRWPAVAAIAVGAALAVAGVRAPLAWLTFALAVFALGLLIGEFVGPARVRQRTSGGSLPGAVLQVALSNRRRYGGYIVHAGVLLVAVGIAASATFRHEGEWTLRKGQAQVFERYALQLDSVWAVQEPNRDGVIAGVTVFREGNVLTRMYPRLNYYRISTEAIGTPAVRPRPREDLYLVLMAYANDGSNATIKAIVSPMVTWIWGGGVVMGLGVVFGLWRRKVTPAPPLRNAERGPGGEVARAGARVG
jgi:cytochrome c-type biogenesis protein CcmF